MKRAVFVALALIFVVGCAQKVEELEPRQEALEEPSRYPFVIQDERGATVVVTESCMYVTGVSWVEEDPEGDWVVVAIVARNTHPNKTVFVSPGDFRLLTDIGTSYSYHIKSSRCDRPFEPMELLPGTQVAGELVYQIFPGEKPTGIAIDTSQGLLRATFQEK